MLVRVKDGKVKAVQGNPNHLFTWGQLCARTNHQECVSERTQVTNLLERNESLRQRR
jgi:hypothetical protein